MGFLGNPTMKERAAAAVMSEGNLDCRMSGRTNFWASICGRTFRVCIPNLVKLGR